MTNNTGFSSLGPDARLNILKEEQKALRRRKRDLEGARDYLGERAEPELFVELKEVQQSLKDLAKQIKTTKAEVDERQAAVLYAVQPDTLTVPFNIRANNPRNNYVTLDEVGTLKLIYNGPMFSLYDFSVFNLQIDRLINDIAISLIRRYGNPQILGEVQQVSIPPYFVDNEDHTIREFPSIGYPIVDVRVSSIRIGSFEEVLSFAILPILADPDIRSILQNIAANVVWLLGSNLGTVIKGSLIKPQLATPMLEIGSNLKEVLLEHARQTGGDVQFEFVREISNQETERTAIHIHTNPPLLDDHQPTRRLPSK